MKQLSSSSKETPGTIPQHSVENPIPHHHLTQTTSSAASAHTSISDCQAHTTASSLPRQACLHLYKPHRRYLMLPRTPCWPQLHCPHGEASADWASRSSPRQLQPCGAAPFSHGARSSRAAHGIQGYTHPPGPEEAPDPPTHRGKAVRRVGQFTEQQLRSPTDFAPACGDNTIKAEPLGTQREPSPGGYQGRALGQRVPGLFAATAQHGPAARTGPAGLGAPGAPRSHERWAQPVPRH